MLLLRRFMFFGLVFILLSGCKRSASQSEKHFQQKDAGKIVFTVSYTSNYNSEIAEIAREKYITFLISYKFKTDSTQADDFEEQIASFREFFFSVNDMSDKVYLNTDKGTFSPVLTNFEDYNSMNNTINLITVFTSDDLELFKSGGYKLFLEDDLFNSGTQEFDFINS